jgi:ABC-type cobalamin transport system permease subunit
MPARIAVLLAGASLALPAHATMVVIIAAPVPALGLVGVAVTGGVALVIGWWRMRK